MEPLKGQENDVRIGVCDGDSVPILVPLGPPQREPNKVEPKSAVLTCVDPVKRWPRYERLLARVSAAVASLLASSDDPQTQYAQSSRFLLREEAIVRDGCASF